MSSLRNFLSREVHVKTNTTWDICSVSATLGATLSLNTSKLSSSLHRFADQRSSSDLFKTKTIVTNQPTNLKIRVQSTTLKTMQMVLKRNLSHSKRKHATVICQIRCCLMIKMISTRQSKTSSTSSTAIMPQWSKHILQRQKANEMFHRTIMRTLRIRISLILRTKLTKLSLTTWAQAWCLSMMSLMIMERTAVLLQCVLNAERLKQKTKIYDPL